MLRFTEYHLLEETSAFYILFYSCEVASRLPENFKAGSDVWENIMDTPWVGCFQNGIYDCKINKYRNRWFAHSLWLSENSWRCISNWKRAHISRPPFSERFHNYNDKFEWNCDQGVFLFFELCVSILQLNLLIAMMTRTYEAISNTTDEYKRQVRGRKEGVKVITIESSLSVGESRTDVGGFSHSASTSSLFVSILYSDGNKQSPTKFCYYEKDWCEEIYALIFNYTESKISPTKQIFAKKECICSTITHNQTMNFTLRWCAHAWDFRFYSLIWK